MERLNHLPKPTGMVTNSRSRARMTQISLPPNFTHVTFSHTASHYQVIYSRKCSSQVADFMLTDQVQWTLHHPLHFLSFPTYSPICLIPASLTNKLFFPVLQTHLCPHCICILIYVLTFCSCFSHGYICIYGHRDHTSLEHLR